METELREVREEAAKTLEREVKEVRESGGAIAGGGASGEGGID